ncbi:response regulator [Candidatus Sumerlaeota bacterium]|nr:response regulator [Candidatus Sumerlaeota bacterium]
MRVLVVDDDPTILALLEEVFQSDPALRLTTEGDSEKADEILSNETIDLLITDLYMPKIDGLRLLEHAMQTNADILVVIITGYASLETTLRAMDMGVYDYITKPFRVEEFRLLLQNAAIRVHLARENRTLRREHAQFKERAEQAEGELSALKQEAERLRDELGRRQEIQPRAARAGNGDAPARAGLSSYEKGLETPAERYDREIRNLQEMFSEGRLSAKEFEAARQRLKTRI